MTDVYGDYRRKTSGREDPRLVRRDSKGSSSSERSKQQYDKLGIPISPKQRGTSNSPPKDSQSWLLHQNTTQNNQYNSSLQTAYQHLPPSLYTDHNQYSSQGYSTSYPAYQQQNYVQAPAYNPYQNYGQAQTGYNTGTVEPGPPGEEYPQNEWSAVTSYPNVNQTSNHPQVVTQPAEDSKKDAVAQELKQQKAEMAKQREEYVRRASVLRRELDLLRNQKQELLAEHSSEHDNNHILRENNKLQIEIQNKMKTIYNVIEMLSNIIGDRLTISELEEQFKEESPKQRREKSRRSVSTDKNNELESRFCYVYYDPELHWCRICDVFPKSAKDYLLHLHSKEHRQITQERDMVDTPWHRLPAEPELPSFEGATKKRMPIKGLQFLISATAWYCKLCDTWVGDLHCASQHLKSQNHNQNFANFVEQNPHWEIEWLRDRDKALVRITKDSRTDSDDSDKESWKNKKKDAPVDGKKDKKKKKVKKRKKHSSDSSSSSSSSDSSSENENSDKSKSIRVAMRNKMKLQAQMIMNEDVGGKWEVLGRLVEEQKKKEACEMGKESENEDNLINQWMTVNEPQEKDKRLFNNLKDRMKQKQEAEKARLAELEQKRLEKEKEEQELKLKKEKEEQELKEKEEEKRRIQEELERQREKEREQIRFKTKEKPKKKSPSKSPEKPPKISKSPSPERKKRERSPERHRRDSHHNENGRHSAERRRRSPSYERDRDSPSRRRSYRDKRSTSSHKKPHFIGRMPLFKNKKNEEKVEKEIKKEDYDIPRQSRFQPGNLARAFIPEPEVVCFPRLSSIPPLMIPPPPVLVPEPPKISEDLKPPPPPIINSDNVDENNDGMETEDNSLPAPPPPPNVTGDMDSDDDYNKDRAFSPSDYEDPMSQLYPETAGMMQYQYPGMDYNTMMYTQMYDYSQDVAVEGPVPPSDDVPLEHTMPLPPPPLPPDDPNEDLAMLGISADDMAAQMF
ncbi:hypothetical protein RN001_003007 [Aquatica leii]|uniref:U1-type domain-containing protein n=1 Tax=Aquatica leii TaxID=1421715 RepID=A0AAN7PN35_9COLE|nr:hypothetical protein RN001_003007 [Aquatica leii]